MRVLTKDIDEYPYTGVRETTGKVRISSNKRIDKFFDGSPEHKQITGVTRGKIYDAVRVEGFGDCEDVTIIDDDGNELTLADYFFEEVE